MVRALAPRADAGIYTFATLSEDDVGKVQRPTGVFREAEGVSIICLLEEAQALDLKHERSFRKITLTVHSSLAAVGLTARVAGALTIAGIPCNVVAAFFHDHLFVPSDRAEEALEILGGLE